VTATTTPDADFLTRMSDLDRLLQEIDAIPDPATRDKAAQAIQGLLDFHAAALTALVNHLRQRSADGSPIDNLARDDNLVSSLLLLHNLHPLDLPARVRLALDDVRPALARHGGSVHLLAVSPDGAVHLRLDGSCHGCPSSAATLQSTIEQAILSRAPDVTAIHVDGAAPAAPASQPASFVPVEQLTRRAGKMNSMQGAKDHVA
jgi:Fe-S cluster biogenesis protein NfuA